MQITNLQINQFSEMISKTTEYSREEKNKLKGLAHDYETKEKMIKKSINKKQQVKFELLPRYLLFNYHWCSNK